MGDSMSNLIIEAFYTGSHKQLADLLASEVLPEKACLITLPGCKWHWRARTGALELAQIIPLTHSFETVFCTAVFNFAELIGLRPDLSSTRKMLYFHENQLAEDAYPVQNWKERDYQYGYNQVISCIVSDEILFNSKYNLMSFLSRVNSFLNKIPNFSPGDFRSQIEHKCTALHFPITLPIPENPEKTAVSGPSRVLLWPHRWEHDKNPKLFFETLQRLKDAGLAFRLIVVGQHFQDNPEIFAEAKNLFCQEIQHWGYVDSRQEYLRLLQQSDIVVSTALHEFYGVAMLEAVFCGALPLCPNRLAYPDIYPKECLYNTPTQLFKELRKLTENDQEFERRRSWFFQNFNFAEFSWKFLKTQYKQLFDEKKNT